jgi:hypothetical protein
LFLYSEIGREEGKKTRSEPVLLSILNIDY